MLQCLKLPAVRGIPGVLDARQDREALEIHVGAAEPVLRQLLARDQQLSGVEVTSAGLQEAFLALTRDDKKPGNRDQSDRVAR